MSTQPLCPTPFSDHVYKTSHGVSIPLRLWPSVIGDGPRPWVMWMHGGGYMIGKHYLPNPWAVSAFRSRGYHVVSIAYRLMPHAGLSDMLEDCLDALQWCRYSLPDILGANEIDLDAYVVGGDSAGATLSTLCGHYFSPPPRVVIDVYGPVDLLDPLFHNLEPDSQLSPERRAYLKPSGRWTIKEIEAELASRDLSQAEIVGPNLTELDTIPLNELRKAWAAPDFTQSDKQYLRMEMMKHVSRTKTFMHTVIRAERFATKDELNAEFSKWSSADQVAQWATYPPTFLLHGTADTSVPVQQSYNLALKLRAKGIQFDERYAHGGAHGFDKDITSPGDVGWDEYIVPMLDFVDKHIRPP